VFCCSFCLKAIFNWKQCVLTCDFLFSLVVVVVADGASSSSSSSSSYIYSLFIVELRQKYANKRLCLPSPHSFYFSFLVFVFDINQTCTPRPVDFTLFFLVF
jgi:hypothetical protein